MTIKMKRKSILVCLIGMLILGLTGCSSKTLSYKGNLGYDFSGIKYSELIFKVYHSNTEDHMWKNIAEFPFTSEKNHFADIRIDGSENHLAVVLENNYCEKEENTVSYFTNDEATYEFDLEGFEGKILTYQDFDIKNTSDEQFYRLYPIGNDYGPIYGEKDLTKPYDVEGANMDNILITLTIQ